MSNTEYVFSRNIPLTPGPKPSSESLPVTLPLDQEALLVTDATALVSDVKSSMFGFPVVENRQFLLQELPQYGIDENTWLNTPATGSVTYLPINSAVNLAIPTGNSLFSSHQTKFAYKYQPGKPIFISQAVQIAKGASIANSFVQWGEYTKNDGYGWRVLSRRGTPVGSVTRWHNYLLFFRRTSAIPSGITSTATRCPSGIVGGSFGVSIGNSTCYRPSYLVGSGNDTTYIGLNTWEDIGFTTLSDDTSDTIVEARFNQDRYTGKEADAAPGISGFRTKPSAKNISYISDSFEISGCTVNGFTITFNNLDIQIGTILSPGMTVRDINNKARIVSVNSQNNTITISATGLSGSTLYFNEESNLCMFLIERSWYGGAGGRGMAYIPDQNPPFNGATRWVPGHEIRVGDTLPVPSMSSPDMPITYMIGKRADKVDKDTSAAFLRRFGVSVWINGGDPRPAKIESASSTGLSVATDSYKIMLAIAVKPFIYNKDVATQDSERPQKSRVYPLSLYVSSTQNTEFYLIKNTTNQFVTDGDWYRGKQDADHLRAVAVLKGSTNTFDSVNYFPSNTGGKLIGAFYCGQDEGTEINLSEIFDPQRELLGRAETTASGSPGDTLTIIARSLGTSSAIASCALTYGVQ
jgi:hypothetical protein